MCPVLTPSDRRVSATADSEVRIAVARLLRRRLSAPARHVSMAVLRNGCDKRLRMRQALLYDEVRHRGIRVQSGQIAEWAFERVRCHEQVADRITCAQKA